MKSKQLLSKAFYGAVFVASTLFVANNAHAQVKIGDNPTSIDPSAVLDVESTNKGVLPPRMTSVQRDAIASPASGLIIFNTTENCLQVNQGTPASPRWICSYINPSQTSLLRFSGSRAYVPSTGVSAIVVPSNTEQVFPNSSYTFNSAGGTLNISYNAFIDNGYNSVTYFRWSHMEYRLYLDGEVIGTQSFEHAPNESASLSITTYKDIAPGSHTIELRAYQLMGISDDPLYNSDGWLRMYSNSYNASVQ